MSHHFVTREGRRLHAAACWCWNGSRSPAPVPPAPVPTIAIRGPVIAGDPRVPVARWWHRWFLSQPLNQGDY